MIECKESDAWNRFWRFRSTNSFGRFINLFRRRFITKMFVRFLLENTQKGTLVEAGCGTGEITLRIAQKRGDKAVLLDSSTDALDQAKALAYELGADATFLHADLLNLPEVLPACEDATVFNIGVVEHFSDCTDALRVMAKTSTSHALAIVPQRSVFWLTYIKAMRVFGILPDDFYVFLFSEKKLIDTVKKADLIPLRTAQVTLFGFIKYLAVFFQVPVHSTFCCAGQSMAAERETNNHEQSA